MRKQIPRDYKVVLENSSGQYLGLVLGYLNKERADLIARNINAISSAHGFMAVTPVRSAVVAKVYRDED